jgi:hypothetical protein
LMMGVPMLLARDERPIAASSVLVAAAGRKPATARLAG